MSMLDRLAEKIYNYFNPTKVEKIVGNDLNKKSNNNNYEGLQNQLSNEHYSALQQNSATQQINNRMAKAMAQKQYQRYSSGQTVRRLLSENNWEYVEILRFDNINDTYFVNIHKITYNTNIKSCAPVECRMVDREVFDNMNYISIDNFQFLNDITEKRSF